MEDAGAAQAHGIQAMSIGFLIDTDTPMVWRGPMVTQALEQLLSDTNWRDLDYLVIDMPPGTGDIQLTLSQKVPVTGAVIVTDTAGDCGDRCAQRGSRCSTRSVSPIVGIVENMSTHVCSNCGHTEPIFGEGGGRAMCHDYNVAIPRRTAAGPRKIVRNPTAVVRPLVADPDGSCCRHVQGKSRARLRSSWRRRENPTRPSSPTIGW